MRTFGRLLLCLLVGLLSLGCGGSSLIKAKGRIIKGGQPYVPGAGEGLRIFFVPLEPPAGSRHDSFAAVYQPDDGTFQVMGKDGKGLPPGKYRVSLQLMKAKEDLLGGKLLGPKSPFICEVTGGHDDLAIDLDKARFDALLAPAKPKKRRG
ncbi:MAG TPA: hypothetical protein VG013_16210 [Gemmataceae bacterium]|jgi:hypothetical protein|nr:hypothetical protein [Gemmataceae bacterium]